MRRGFTPLDRGSHHLTGFTLLEAVIVVTLLGLVGLSFGYLSSLAQRLMIQGMNSSASQGEAAFALEHIKRHLTPATSITTPPAGGQGAVLVFAWQPTAILAVRTSRYELNGTDLRFIPNTASPGTFEVVSRGIQSINFNRAVSRTVSVNVTARKTTVGDTRDMRLQTTIIPRGLLS